MSAPDKCPHCSAGILADGYRFTCGSTIPGIQSGVQCITCQRDQLRAQVADLRVKLANRDAQIAALIAAGDALGVDQTRPGWQRRWAAWMKAKGF